jgi:hypothetical protein
MRRAYKEIISSVIGAAAYAAVDHQRGSMRLSATPDLVSCPGFATVAALAAWKPQLLLLEEQQALDRRLQGEISCPQLITNHQLG